MTITASEIEESVRNCLKEIRDMPVPVSWYDIEWGLDHVHEPALFIRVILQDETTKEQRKQASELIEQRASEVAPNETTMVYVSFSTEAEESVAE